MAPAIQRHPRLCRPRSARHVAKTDHDLVALDRPASYPERAKRSSTDEKVVASRCSRTPGHAVGPVVISYPCIPSVPVCNCESMTIGPGNSGNSFPLVLPPPPKLPARCLNASASDSRGLAASRRVC